MNIIGKWLPSTDLLLPTLVRNESLANDNGTKVGRTVLAGQCAGQCAPVCAKD